MLIVLVMVITGSAASVAGTLTNAPAVGVVVPVTVLPSASAIANVPDDVLLHNTPMSRLAPEMVLGDAA